MWMWMWMWMWMGERVRPRLSGTLKLITDELVLGSRNESEDAETGRKGFRGIDPRLCANPSGVQLKSPPRMPNFLYRA